MKEYIDKIILNHYLDIKDQLIILLDYIKNDYTYTGVVYTEEECNIIFNRIISILYGLKDKNKLDIINQEFINDTSWFTTAGNYLDILYAIFNKEDFIKNNEDEYLFNLTSVILKSNMALLNNKGKKYHKYFYEFNEVMKLYSVSHIFLRRDHENGLLNKSEYHFYEIVLATFLSYYYKDYDNIPFLNVSDTITKIFNYQEFLESLEIKGFDKTKQDSYKNEIYIAKTLINNINTKKQKIK